MWKRLRGWWSGNWQPSAAVAQTLVAILMLTSLWQNGRLLRQNRQALEISQRQWEASVRPNIDLILTSGGYVFICNHGVSPVRDVRIIAILHSWLRFPKWDPVQKQISGGITPIAASLAAGDTLTYALKDHVFQFDPEPEWGTQDVMCCVFEYARAADMHPYYKSLSFMRSYMPGGSKEVTYWPLRAMPGSAVPIVDAWSGFCKRV